MTWVYLAHGWKGAGCEMDDGRSGQVSIDVTDTFYDLLTIWSGWKQFICHWSSQCLTTRWCNCSLFLNHPELAQRSKNNFVTVRGLLASAFPWLQPLQLFPMGVCQTPRLKGQARVHLWLQDSDGRYQCGNIGQIHLCNSSNCPKAVQGIFASKCWQFWALFDIHVELELVSIRLDFYTILKIGPCWLLKKLLFIS